MFYFRVVAHDRTRYRYRTAPKMNILHTSLRVYALLVYKCKRRSEFVIPLLFSTIISQATRAAGVCDAYT